MALTLKISLLAGLLAVTAYAEPEAVAPAEATSAPDTPTLLAIGATTYFMTALLHEGLGHEGGCAVEEADLPAFRPPTPHVREASCEQGPGAGTPGAEPRQTSWPEVEPP